MAEESDHQQSPPSETGDVEDAEDRDEDLTVGLVGSSPGKPPLLLISARFGPFHGARDVEKQIWNASPL